MQKDTPVFIESGNLDTDSCSNPESEQAEGPEEEHKTALFPEIFEHKGDDLAVVKRKDEPVAGRVLKIVWF